MPESMKKLDEAQEHFPYSAKKNLGGRSIIVSFDEKQTSEYHAPWLWYNDSRNTMMPSGQKKLTAGSWINGTVIEEASICHFSEIRNVITSNGKEDIEKVMFNSKREITQPINTTSPNFAEDSGGMNAGRDGSHPDLFDFLLVIRWNRSMNHNKTSGKEDFISIYNMLWLKRWSYDSSSMNELRLKREVSEKDTFLYKYRQMKTGRNEGEERPALISADREIHGGLVSVDYRCIESDDIGDELLTFFDSLFLEGAVIVTNALPSSNPENLDDIVCKVGKQLSGGSLSHGSLYGDTFHVRAKKNANNVAFTSVNLCPHQDMAYYESKPGFQLLHCIKNAVGTTGGESILIDCMAAAHRFRQLAPDLFEILVKCPATFVKSREGACMAYSKPHIALYNDGRCDLNDMDREIVSVHWSPPFEGSVQMHPDRIEDYFKAYAAFELMLDSTKCPIECSKASGISLDLAMSMSEYAKKYTWVYRLKLGEMLVFNNTRMLHGRRSFEVAPEENGFNRHLIGAYTNIDDSLNNYRVLLREVGCAGRRVIPNVGNGSTMLEGIANIS